MHQKENRNTIEKTDNGTTTNNVLRVKKGIVQRKVRDKKAKKPCTMVSITMVALPWSL